MVDLTKGTGQVMQVDGCWHWVVALATRGVVWWHCRWVAVDSPAVGEAKTREVATAGGAVAMGEETGGSRVVVVVAEARLPTVATEAVAAQLNCWESWVRGRSGGRRLCLLALLSYLNDYLAY